MNIRFAALTVPGRVRPTNQDSVLALDGPRKGSYVFAVADGVGGLTGGAEASRRLVEALAAAAGECEGSLSSCLDARIAATNAQLYEEGARTGRPSGTTLVAIVVDEGKFEVLHAGDSRAYLFRTAHLQRLTEDHAWVAEQVRAGALTEAEAAESPHRNIITRCVGIEPLLEVDHRPPEACSPGDLFLLSSDGLHGLVRDNELAEALGRDDPASDLARRLVNLANERGGTDNISVVLARVES